MADGVFNIAKGRGGELYKRVDIGDPSAARIGILILKASGLTADDDLNNYDTITALLASANDEATNTGYGRVTWAAADITVPSPDDTNNRVDYDIPDYTWTAVQATGGAWGKLVTFYSASDVSSSGDATNIPFTYHDFSITPDGSDITAVVNAAGFYRVA